jgi:putative FmdB family regulatory protein
VTVPIYEYTCKSCNAKFEQLVRSMSGNDESSKAKVKCPECNSAQTARALSVFAVSSESGRSASADAPACGRCGGAPGSCQL